MNKSLDYKKIELMKKLIEYWRNTPKHYEGKILGSMTTYPDSLAIYAYILFIHTNYSDKVIFHTLSVFEEELVNEVGSLYGKPGTGLITSGGSESNFLALLSAKKSSSGKNNIVIAPDTIHVSVDKACDIMGCRLLKIPASNKPIDPSLLEDYVRKYKPFSIVVTAGTTERGLIDPVKEVAEIAYNTNTYLHIDASYGGLLIPFLYKHGYIDENLYFYQGVSSICVDFHKNGLAPIPSSLLLFSEKDYMNKICYETSYMLSGKTCGLLGTRPGASVASTWVVWKYYGVDGYEEISLDLINKAHYLYKRLSEIKDMLVYKPILPIVVFKHRYVVSEKILDKLLSRRFYLYRSPSLNALRIVVMPHVEIRHINEFVDALAKVIHEIW